MDDQTPILDPALSVPSGEGAGSQTPLHECLIGLVGLSALGRGSCVRSSSRTRYPLHAGSRCCCCYGSLAGPAVVPCPRSGDSARRAAGGGSILRRPFGDPVSTVCLKQQQIPNADGGLGASRQLLAAAAMARHSDLQLTTATTMGPAAAIRRGRQALPTQTQTQRAYLLAADVSACHGDDGILEPPSPVPQQSRAEQSAFALARSTGTSWGRQPAAWSLQTCDVEYLTGPGGRGRQPAWKGAAAT